MSLFLFFQIVFVSASTFFSLFFQKPLFSFFRKILSYKFVFFAKRDTFSFCVLHFAKRYRTGLFLLFYRKHKSLDDGPTTAGWIARGINNQWHTTKDENLAYYFPLRFIWRVSQNRKIHPPNPPIRWRKLNFLTVQY